MSKNIHATQDWVRDNLGIKPTASGELISLSDSAEQPLQSMKIYGKTTQFTTTGKNKLPYPYRDPQKTVTNGITYTVNSDGSVTANGTAIGMADFNLLGSGSSRVNFEEGEYVVSGCPLNGEQSTYRIMIVENNDGSDAYHNDTGTGYNLTVKQGTTISIVIRIMTGTTVSNLTFYPMIRPADITDTTWEPYTGGIPSPNPNYPQELVSVGDGGSTTEYVMGGNLFNNDVSLLKEVAYNSFDGTNRRIGYEPLQLPAGTYTFTLTELDASVPKYVYGSINDKDGNFVRSCHLLQSTNNFTPLTITVNEGDKIYIYDGYRTIEDAREITFSKVQIQLNAGSTEKPYEPYKEQSLTIPTPNGLPGIPVSSGGNYTDSNGQQYVCDYKDHERNVYVQRTGEYRNTGEPMSMASAIISSKNKKVIYWNHCLYNIKPHKIQENKTIISNYFVSSYKYVSTEGCCSMISHSAANNGTYLYFSASADTLEYGTTYTDVRTAISAWLAKTFSEDNPLIVRYQLAEPIETPLTEEEIQAYKALHTNYPNTTIYNSDGAGAEVEYVADTKIYVDNKFAELQANILKATE